MRNARLDEAQAGIKIARRHTDNLTFAYDSTLMAETEEEVKCLLMKVKRRVKKVAKSQHSENQHYGIWSHHFMANRSGDSGTSGRLIWGALKSL